jgi:hypothetical protein
VTVFSLILGVIGLQASVLRATQARFRAEASYLARR